jgi:hypothetical protein
MMQFNHGKFTECQAKQVLSVCFDNAWVTIKDKFEFDGTYYWNVRLQEEIEKRKNFIESRRCSGLVPKTKKASAKHMLKRGINKDINKDIYGNKNEIPPILEFVKKYCEDRNNGIDAEYFINWYAVRDWRTGKNQTPVLDWQACIRTWENRKKKSEKLIMPA